MKRTIVVDSGVYPLDGSIRNRFCLGAITRANSDASIGLSQFGVGISIIYVHGKIFVDNLSNHSLFVQSWTGTENYNTVCNENHHRATVMEIKESLVGICVFDLSIFAKDLEVKMTIETPIAYRL